MAYRVFCLPKANVIYTRPCVSTAPCPGHCCCSPVTLSCSAGSLRDRLLDPSLLRGPPGCGTENVGQRHRRRLCQAGVWVMLLHPRADKLPCSETSRWGSWHLQASSQLPALSHPSLGRGSGNAAAFSGCLDFGFFFFYTAVFLESLRKAWQVV